jgi:hypothetical protein
MLPKLHPRKRNDYEDCCLLVWDCVLWYKRNSARFQVLIMALLRTEVFQDIQLWCWASEWFPMFWRIVMPSSSASTLQEKQLFFLGCLILEHEGSIILQNIGNHSPTDTAPSQNVTMWIFLYFQFSWHFLHSVTSSLVHRNILLNTLFSNNLNPHPSLRVRQQVP